MAKESRASKRTASPSWLASLMGAVFLISAGFMLGLVVGVVKEEPELVIEHLAGQDEEIRWSEKADELGPPNVAARGPLPGSADEWGDGGSQRKGQAKSAIETREGRGREENVGKMAAGTTAEDVGSRVFASQQARLISSLPAPEKTATKKLTNTRSKRFSVQVGAFSESLSAERILEDLRRKGFQVYITPSAESRDGRWRVRVGPMDTRVEADRVANQLKTREQLPTWVLSEGGD